MGGFDNKLGDRQLEAWGLLPLEAFEHPTYLISSLVNEHITYHVTTVDRDKIPIFWQKNQVMVIAYRKDSYAHCNISAMLLMQKDMTQQVVKMIDYEFVKLDRSK